MSSSRYASHYFFKMETNFTFVIFVSERHGVRGNHEIQCLFNMSMTAMRHEIETNHAPIKGDVTVLDTLLAKLPTFRWDHHHSKDAAGPLRSCLVLRHPHPLHSRDPDQFVVPSCWRPTASSVWTPLETFLPPSSIISASDLSRSLPLRSGDSSSYVGGFNFAADLIKSDLILQRNSEHSPLHRPLSDPELPYEAQRKWWAMWFIK